MNRSYESADKYDKQFETPLLSILARCLSYIAGGIVALLAILALIDDNILLQVTFLDRNLLWYTALFGGLLAISRSFISEREKVRSPLPLQLSVGAAQFYLSLYCMRDVTSLFSTQMPLCGR